MAHNRLRENAAEWRRIRDSRKRGVSGTAGYRPCPVADVVRQQELRDGKSNNLVEAGLRYQLSPLMVLTAGAGVAFGRKQKRESGQ
jgi:hypothetical protein